MPTNGMTIDGLNTVSSLTAQDKVPVWDNESSGEPTRKITAQNLTNSVKTLGSLVNTTEMNTAIAQSTANVNCDTTWCTKSTAEANAAALCRKIGNAIFFDFIGVDRTHAQGETILTLNEGFRPKAKARISGSVNGTVVIVAFDTDGAVTIYSLPSSATASGRLYFSGVIFV